METDKIKILLEAIRAGNLSYIAVGLGYTPSGISRAISSLEEEVGFPLLVRHRTGVSPTADCKRLIPVMQELLERDEQIKILAAGIRGLQIGTVVVGTVYNLFYHTISQMITSFVKDYPGINVHFVTGSSSGLANKLDQGKIDVCLISHRVGNFSWTPLFEDDLIVWVPESHPCAKTEVYPMERFAFDPYISVFPDTEPNDVVFFKKENLHPNIKFTAGDVDVAFAMVDAGLGVSVVNGLSADARLGRGKVVTLQMNPRQKVEVGLAVANREAEAPAAKHFIKFAVSYFCDHLDRVSTQLGGAPARNICLGHNGTQEDGKIESGKAT